MNRLRGIVTIFVTATCGLGWAVAVPATAAAETVPPTITITSPTEGQFYALNAPITGAFSCADPGGSGVNLCGRIGPAESTATAGAHTYTVFASDNDGNTATKVVNYFVDATGPTITITAPTDGQHFELGATLSASFSCADTGGSGVATCVAATPLDTSIGTHTYTVNATDNVGNPSSKSITYTVDPDTTDPTITINSPTDGQHFALGATITADYDCADAGGSGLATCVAATPLDTTVGSHIYTVNASDNNAGNTATKSITYTVDPDTTNPTITINSPTDGQHFVLGAAINADYDCDDAGGSGLATCVAATPINTTVGSHIYTVNASDNAGNTATKSVTYIVDPDTTNPTITITEPTDGKHYVFGAAIVADFDCADAGGSGLATCVAATPINTAVGTHVYTVNASDNAGNTATKSVTYSVDDVTPPTITITVPTEGQHFAFGATINASFGCSDPGGSGVATCTAASTVDYSVGTHTYTVNATDNAGNPATKSVNYTVDPDTTPPTITITSPVDGRHYAFGTTFPGAYSCDDTGGSGVATCAASTSIDLSPGTHVFTVNSTDGHGNATTKSVTYIIDAAPGGGGGETPAAAPRLPRRRRRPPPPPRRGARRAAARPRPRPRLRRPRRRRSPSPRGPRPPA